MNKLGVCTVPDGKSGDWTIDTFTISLAQADAHNFWMNIRGTPELNVEPGTYRRLRNEEEGVVMSNTPMELRTNMSAAERADGRVLVNGLGLGMFLEYILQKPTVTYVRVIERSPDVIALVAGHFAHDPRVEIIEADAMQYCPEEGEQFDFAWHDIWTTISDENLVDMQILQDRYMPFVGKSQGCWARRQCLRMQRALERIRSLEE